ncbi:MAG: trypsin-like peptidase domain-containing protein [Microthrixaceae bacterium]
MRRTPITIVATLCAILSALTLTSGPAAQAAPNCTNALAPSVAGKPAPVGTPYTCANPVHPGARISVAGSHGGAGGSCTANFAFTGSDGRSYLGTAGHCTLAASNLSGDRGEWADAVGTGPQVKDSTGRTIGRITYAIQQDPKDIALIRLETGIVVDKAMPHWGAVTGINTTSDTMPMELRWVGHGVGIGSVLYARTGVTTRTTNPDTIYGVGAIAPGDSGGPVVDAQGRAVGVNVTIGASVGTNSGVQFITRLAPQLARATAVTGVTYTLAT